MESSRKVKYMKRIIENIWCSNAFCVFAFPVFEAKAFQKICDLYFHCCNFKYSEKFKIFYSTISEQKFKFTFFFYDFFGRFNSHFFIPRSLSSLKAFFISWIFIVSTFFIPVTLQDFSDTLLSDIIELQYK